ncbi:hypothetical protein SAMD00023353_0403530 [Rosellinia necatrix]|uniref:Uncharacterized protein n=1 Tax=Rosellinia necatrix TaxID=77044 RepID=A0A1S7UJA9_ROSNE|nr:hypothetical protein SAMD00023353_0403530 [Rosellinia necatrix]
MSPQTSTASNKASKTSKSRTGTKKPRQEPRTTNNKTGAQGGEQNTETGDTDNKIGAQGGEQNTETGDTNNKTGAQGGEQKPGAQGQSKTRKGQSYYFP